MVLPERCHLRVNDVRKTRFAAIFTFYLTSRLISHKSLLSHEFPSIPAHSRNLPFAAMLVLVYNGYAILQVIVEETVIYEGSDEITIVPPE